MNDFYKGLYKGIFKGLTHVGSHFHLQIHVEFYRENNFTSESPRDVPGTPRALERGAKKKENHFTLTYPLRVHLSYS